MLVSHLGLGTWRWGSETDEDDAADQLISFHEAGGTLVDTGTSYSAGRSEEILGRLLGDVIPCEELVIATKAGLRWRGEQAMIDASRGALLRQLDLSLRRLGIDHIDLWQLHVPDDEVPIEETIELARMENLHAVLNTRTESTQEQNRSAGVSWANLAFAKQKEA